MIFRTIRAYLTKKAAIDMGVAFVEDNGELLHSFNFHREILKQIVSREGVDWDGFTRFIEEKTGGYKPESTIDAGRAAIDHIRGESNVIEIHLAQRLAKYQSEIQELARDYYKDWDHELKIKFILDGDYEKRTPETFRQYLAEYCKQKSLQHVS